MLTLGSLLDPDAWAVHNPAGAASHLLTVTAASAPDGGLNVAATAGAAGHYAEGTLGAAVDLSTFTDLQLLASATAQAGIGVSGWELRLGGAGAAAVGAGANDWARLIPSSGALGSLVLVSIDDLEPAARAALTTVRITRVDPASGNLGLQAIAALREEILADVDAALVDRLTGATAGGEGPIPAVVTEAGVAPPNPPYLRITNFDVRPAPERDSQSRARTDYTSGGFTERPPRAAFDLLYEVTVFADSRAVEAGLIDHVLAQLAAPTSLIVNGWPLSTELVGIPAALGATRPDRVTLWVAVHATQRRAITTRPAVPPFAAVDVEADVVHT
jgi:hypothetical protein